MTFFNKEEHRMALLIASQENSATYSGDAQAPSFLVGPALGLSLVLMSGAFLYMLSPNLSAGGTQSTLYTASTNGQQVSLGTSLPTISQPKSGTIARSPVKQVVLPKSGWPAAAAIERSASLHPLAPNTSIAALLTAPLLVLVAGIAWALRPMMDKSQAGQVRPLGSVFSQQKHLAIASITSEVEKQSEKQTEKRISNLSDYVSSRRGSLPIRKILVANNGMAATKFIHSVRTWSYLELGDEKAIEFVAMASPEDLRANAKFLALADKVVDVPAGGNKNNYANVSLIISTATEQGVDAVWPGWGHASENPALSDGLKAAGIKFIGPPGRVMAALGDKVAANIFAQSAQVPCIPWSGDGLVVDAKSGVIPKEIFDAACVTSKEQALEAAERIGFPLMIKASEGGGGKGIRMAQNKEETAALFEQVCNEVPGSPVFLMQLCSGARHIEIQIVGDEHGSAVALNGRDCSTQRRFQKIFEEGPPIITPPDVFRQMELSALRLTQSIGYVGAGTVEYLYQPSTNSYYFLELNPRLQVEHPVTEDLTGVNVPATQLQVAMGIPLSSIPDIRRFYGRQDPYGHSKIAFADEQYPPLKTHVIAARITAENPDEGFKPTSGSVSDIRFRSTPNVWGYFSIGSNGGIHEFADSQFGHLFSRGSTREDARKHLILALKNMEVRGEIRTPVDYLVKLLESDAFKNNTIDTSWLDKLLKERRDDPNLNVEEIVICAVIYRAFEHIRNAQKELLQALQKGQISMTGIREMNVFPVELTYRGVKYPFTVARTSPSTLRLSLNGGRIDASVRLQVDGSLLCSYGKSLRFVAGMEEPLGLRIVINGMTHMIPNTIDPSELRSDVNGRLVRYLQEDGTPVSKGRPYAEVEAMKMIMSLVTTESGVISHMLTPGSIISPGDQLAFLQLADPTRSAKVRPFTGTIKVQTDDAQTQDVLQTLNLVLDGFECDDVEAVAQSFLAQEQDTHQLTAQIGAFLERYMEVEQHFINDSLDESILNLIKSNKDNLDVVVALNMAHQQLRRRNMLVLSLLRQVPILPFTPLKPVLSQLAQLPGGPYGEVALSAAQILDASEQPPFEQISQQVRQQLQEAKGQPINVMNWLSVGVDFLSAVFDDKDKTVALVALEVYVRKVLYPHNILSLQVQQEENRLIATWQYRLQQLPAEEGPARCGLMVVIPTWNIDDFAQGLQDGCARIQQQVANSSTDLVPIHDLHIGFARCAEANGDSYLEQLQPIISTTASALTNAQVAQLNVLIPQPPSTPLYYSFPAVDGYKENPLNRKIRPGVSQLLELSRLKDYNLQPLPCKSRYARVYLGTEKPIDGQKGPAQQALFLRTISYKNQITLDYAELVLMTGLDELERSMLDPRVSNTASSRMFLNLPTVLELDQDNTVGYFRDILDNLFARHAPRLLKLRVDEIEVAVRVPAPNGNVQLLRLIASSMTGEWLRVSAWQEYPDPVTGITQRFCTVGEEETMCSFEPYPTSTKVGAKRAAARRVGSSFAYDFLGLMNRELIQTWTSHQDDASAAGLEVPRMPSKLFEAQALIKKDGKLLPSDFSIVGSNAIGMLAWLCKMKTPEYPSGREIVVIANDVTVQNGSFGVAEDEFFELASEYARKHGLPRVYISCNSGARIGLIESLKPKFHVAFKNPENPALGYDYLYLLEEDYLALPPGVVQGDFVTAANGDRHFRLSDIIGLEHGIGVENLRGSGMIAGETSRAYQDIFTLSYVTGRSVGIGAYLVRLGQRVIQNENAPIILTGHSALNSLLGREVYSSMDQLGGPQIMYNNGVSHQVVANDQEGVQAIMRWLSFVPRNKWAMPPCLPIVDPIERDVDFKPTKVAYDPRHMIAGTVTPDGTWLSGFFDRDSFQESMANWGKSVVVGRARLGGIPFGCIAVETRMVEQRIPADPANPESRESILPQAGQVWYPDSSYKTAQAINDFNRGENLPLMIFANWRGFSGGTRDMYGEILKFGAMIVDALVAYKHPVFVYIPPNAELRGGSWVVIDPTINSEVMEMYADPESRGGILEPAGIAAIKFRQPDQTAKMHQLDPQIKMWDQQLVEEKDQAKADELKKKIRDREIMLMPLYLQIAHEFADLHDRSGRMKAKGVIHEVVEWRRSREYFYWRAQRRVQEGEILRQLRQADPKLTHTDATEFLQNKVPDYSNDHKFLEYLASHPECTMDWVRIIRKSAVNHILKDLLSEVPLVELQESITGIAALRTTN